MKYKGVIKIKPRFNCVYSRDNLPNKIKDSSWVINLDEYTDIGTHWIFLYSDDHTKTQFDNFGVDHIPKEIEEFLDNKNKRGSTITPNIYRIQVVLWTYKRIDV